MRPFQKQLAVKLIGAALFVSALPSAFAVVLFPGDTVLTPGTTSAARPELAGLVLEDVTRNWVISTPQGDITGRIQDRVVREDVAQTLDFYTRIFVDDVPDFPVNVPPPFSGILVAERSSYGGFTTDVDWRIDGLGGGPAGNTAPTEASRSLDGSLVSFLFGDGRVTPADLPDGSKFFFIKTNATAYNPFGSINLGTNPGASQNFTTQFNVFQPIPEPSSLALLLAGLLGVGVVAYRRRK